MKKYIIITAVIGVLALVGYNVRDAVFGTPLQVVAAENGSTIYDSFVSLSGVARQARELLINGRSVALDRSGNFTDAIILSPGYNIVEIALKDRFGKTETKTYHWVVEPSPAVAQGNSEDFIN